MALAKLVCACRQCRTLTAHSLQLTAHANIETNPIQPLSWAKPVESRLASWCANEVSDPYRPNFVLGFAEREGNEFCISCCHVSEWRANPYRPNTKTCEWRAVHHGGSPAVSIWPCRRGRAPPAAHRHQVAVFSSHCPGARQRRDGGYPPPPPSRSRCSERWRRRLALRRGTRHGKHEFASSCPS